MSTCKELQNNYPRQALCDKQSLLIGAMKYMDMSNRQIICYWQDGFVEKAAHRMNARNSHRSVPNLLVEEDLLRHCEHLAPVTAVHHLKTLTPGTHHHLHMVRLSMTSPSIVTTPA